MADETPEKVRERVLAEELGKGSDPRVAEGRAKAAEVRARHGLPVDPDQAWRAKLEREGGAPAAPVAEAAAPQVEEAVGAPAEAVEAPTEAAPEPAPAPAPAMPEPAPPPPELAAAAAAPAAPAAPPEPEFEPEIGEPIAVETEGLEEYAGIKVRDSRLPAWLLIVLVAIPLWAMFYLAAFSGSESVARTSGCTVKPDRTFTCFEPPGGEGGGTEE